MFKLFVIVALMTVAFAVGRPHGHLAYGRSAYGVSHAGAYAAPHGAYSAPGGYAADYAQPTPYNYGYDIAGDHGEFKQQRQESGDGHGNVQGSYGYTDAHGIYRQVDYVADAHGYRAQVKTNEPGTDNQSPADVDLHAAPAQYHQPAPYAASYAAPRYGHPRY